MRDVWFFLFFLGLVAFNWPLLGIFGKYTAGYLFLSWGALIGLVAYFSHRADRPGG